MPSGLLQATSNPRLKGEDFVSQPVQLIGQTPLMDAMFHGDDLSDSAEALLARARTNELDADALLDLACVLLLRGDRQTGLSLQQQALSLKRLYQPRRATQTPELRLLVLKAAGDFMANTPLEFLTDHPQISVDVLYLAPDLPLPLAPPDHDAVFVAATESQPNRPLLRHINELLQHWQLPILNRPHDILPLRRDLAWQKCRHLPGVNMPCNRRLSRSQLLQHEQLPGWPFIIRPPDTHAGDGMVKIESGAMLDDYLAAQVHEEYYLADFVDYRSNDGLYRKYRIVVIDGIAMLCHMAISSHWMVHYLNADMSDNAAKKSEEAQAMARFDTDFCRRHNQALAGLVETIGLDYFGIDCAETPAGELLVFEVANAMVVHSMDPESVYPYKAAQMRRVFSAFQALLFNRAGVNELSNR